MSANGEKGTRRGKQTEYQCTNVSVGSVIVFVDWKVKYFGTEVLRDNNKRLPSFQISLITFCLNIFIPQTSIASLEIKH